jgi:hypothetical protein
MDMYNTIEDLPKIEYDGEVKITGFDVCLNPQCPNKGNDEKWVPKRRGLCSNCYMNLDAAITRMNALNKTSLTRDDFVKFGKILQKRFGAVGGSTRKISQWFLEGVEFNGTQMAEAVDPDDFEDV